MSTKSRASDCCKVRTTCRPCGRCYAYGENKDIYRQEPGRRRECLYYLALGHYKMGNYEEARRFNGTCSPQFPVSF